MHVWQEMVGDDYRTFFRALLAAFIIHALALFTWEVLDIWETDKVPARVLRVQLGDARVFSSKATKESSDEDSSPSKSNERTSSAKSTAPSPAVTAKTNKQVKAEPVSKPVAKPAPQKKSTPTPVKKERTHTGKEGSKLGTAKEAQEKTIKRYEQKISAWIKKYQRYPAEARRENALGTAIVRVRINRAGNVVYRQLEKKSGHAVLDREAMNMVQRANPVPSPPANYPIGSTGLVEFLIPIIFDEIE